MASHIHQLPEEVVNRIAAGEVIQRPFNALKELIENSLDAKSTQISVSCSPTSTSIADDGHGIHQQDLPLVCQRFATSKIEKYEDLENVATFGFRGEALASLSHVSLVTVTTKTKDSNVAYKAKYLDGTMTECKPCAGNQGTIIAFDDLFHNVPMRRKALKPFAEEYAKMLDIVQRYAVHCSGKVGFSIKRGNQPDIVTNVKMSTPDVIKMIYGVKDLLEVKMDGCNGWISGLDHLGKRTISLIFINNRLVECASLRKSIESVYATLLPRASHPWFYLSLTLNPKTVDVNVHPTKKDVHFLNEDEIVQKIVDHVTELLSNVQSRNFAIGTAQEPTSSGPPTAKSTKVPKTMVRTDAKSQTLKSFWGSRMDETIEEITVELSDEETPQKSKKVETIELSDDEPMLESAGSGLEEPVRSQPTNSQPKDVPARKRVKVEKWIDVKLNSILDLRQEVEDVTHHGLTESFRKLIYVGLADLRLVLIQVDLKLLLLDIGEATREMFYHLGLKYFANFGKLQLDPPVNVVECLQIALDDEEARRGGWEGLQSKQEISKAVTDLLWSKQAMLEEYFSMELMERDGDVYLTSLPMMLRSFEVPMEKLPLFLLRLGSEVDWTKEKPCFQDFLQQVAKFYALQDYDINDTGRYEWLIEHVIVPALRGNLLVPKRWTTGSVLVEVTNLPKLYTIFERC